MIAIFNIVLMSIASFFSIYFYVKSAQPASFEKKIGAAAYKRCANYRMISGVFMFLLPATFITYLFFPLPVPFPHSFPWKYFINIIVSIAIAIPALYLFVKGIIDAGEEVMTPKKEHQMYKGIYTKIRHPQAIGEYLLLLIFSILLNSPFLILVTLLYLPPWIYMCFAEEKDLVIRYGKPYIDYKKMTGMFFPKFKKNSI